GQLVVADVEGRGRGLGGPGRLGRDGGDDVAHVQRAVEGEHGLVPDLDAVPAEPAYVVGNERDAPRRQCRDVDRDDARVRVRRADEPRMQLIRQLEVLRVTDGAGDGRVVHVSSSSARRPPTGTTPRR